MTFARRFEQSSRKAQPTSAPQAAVPEPTGPGPYWAAWNLTAPTTATWSAQSCPKCLARKAADKPSLQVHPAGPFWCARCDYGGDASKLPASSRATWLQSFRVFLADPSRPSLPPAGTPNLQGCTAPFWNGHDWVEAWYAFCRKQPGAEIDDAFIRTDDGLWHRQSQTKPTPLGVDHALSSPGRLFITLHPEDMALLTQTFNLPAVCMPPDIDPVTPSAPVWSALAAMEELANNALIVFATRPDVRSREIEEELGRRFDRERCSRVRWTEAFGASGPEEKTPSAAVATFGHDRVQAFLDGAQPFPVAGLHELADFDDRLEELYETGLQPGEDPGWPTFGELYTVKPGQWTMVGGIPGHGKSTLLDELLVNLSENAGWRHGIFSPENQPVERHFAGLMERKVGKPFSKGPTPRITREEKDAAKAWLNDKFKIILPDENSGIWTLDAILRLAKTLVYRYGIRGLVIDPWNEIEHDIPGGMRETDYISSALTKIRRFARLYDLHVWIVVHPTKLEKREDGIYPVPTPYNAAGGAHWRNKADNIICPYRFQDKDDHDLVDIHVQKIRFAEIGRIGVATLRYDMPTRRYVDDVDQDARAAAVAKGLHLKSSAIRLSAPRKRLPPTTIDTGQDWG